MSDHQHATNGLAAGNKWPPLTLISRGQKMLMKPDPFGSRHPGNILRSDILSPSRPGMADLRRRADAGPWGAAV